VIKAKMEENTKSGSIFDELFPKTVDYRELLNQLDIAQTDEVS
jgi:hypothetical protein